MTVIKSTLESQLRPPTGPVKTVSLNSELCPNSDVQEVYSTGIPKAGK